MVADVAECPPSAALAPFVGRYVGYRMEGFAPGVHRGLPGRMLTFIVSLGDPVEMEVDAGARRSDAFVGGLSTRAAVIRHDGSQHGIAVELSPLGARALLGLPASELTGESVDLVDLWGRDGALLPERLADVPSWPGRFAAVDAALRARLRPEASPAAAALGAWRLMTGRPGPVAVGEMARELGWSRRHLGECVRREVGLAPSELTRVLRFERSRHLIGRGGLTMTEVALAAGYYDHAHMLREWRRMAGCRPAEWLAEELPSVQDSLGSEGP